MNDPIYNMLGSTDDKMDYILKRINRIQNTLDNLNKSVSSTYVLGRLRFDRSAPTSSTDIFPSDLLYDRVVTNSFEYILTNNAGVLNWVRTALSTF
jgi:hypothetical protein